MRFKRKPKNLGTLGPQEHGYIDAGDLAGKEKMGPKHRANLFYPHDAIKRTQYVDGWMMAVRENPSGRHRVFTEADFKRHAVLEPVAKAKKLLQVDALLREIEKFRMALRTERPKKQRRARRNPAGFHIHVQKGKGPVMRWNGKSFNNQPDSQPTSFSSAASATKKARQLAKLRQLSGYKIWVSKSSRRVNPESLDAAAQKLEDFTGTKPTHTMSARPRSSQKTGLVIGELDLIGYRAARKGIEGGRLTRYAHKFRKGSRPLLAVSTDGKQLHVVGGQYEFTEAGIEDR